jgi:hypothetical protein
MVPPEVDFRVGVSWGDFGGIRWLWSRHTRPFVMLLGRSLPSAATNGPAGRLTNRAL